MYYSEIIVAGLFVAIVIVGVLLNLPFIKMLNILVENNKGSWWFCYRKLWFSLDFFKRFINEVDFDSKQRKRYFLLYRTGLFIKITWFLIIIVSFVCLCITTI